MPQKPNLSSDENPIRSRDLSFQQRLQRVNDLAKQLTEQQAFPQSLPVSSPPVPVPVVVSLPVPPKLIETEALPAAISNQELVSPSTVVFTLTTDDLIANEIYHVHHVSAFRRMQFYGQLVWLALAGCIIWILVLLFLLSTHWLMLVVVGIFAIFALSVLISDLLFKNYCIRKKIEKAVRAGKYRDMFVQQDVTISSEGYTIVSPYVELKTAWQIVKQIAVTDTHIYLFTSESGAHVIPRRAMIDREGADAFARQIQQYHGAVHQQTSSE